MAPAPRPTLKDVARLAGVSTGVASNVLSGNRNAAIRTSAQTQARVREAAARLGYRPNALARSLQGRRTQTLLLAMYAVPNLTKSPFHAEVLDGVLTRALDRGYQVTIQAVRKEDAEKPGVFGDGRADGCLWVAPWLDDAAVSAAASASTPLVILYARVVSCRHCVVADNRQGIRLAVEHLARHGHRYVVFSEAREDWKPYDLRERAAAFQVACADLGLKGEVVSSVRLRELLSLAPPERPTGLIGWHDNIAVDEMRVAQTLGLSVPEDLSVIGFNSTPLCESTTPRLTSVYQPLRAMAEWGVDLLIDELEGSRTEGGPGNLHPFPCRLDVRDSTGPAPEALRCNGEVEALR